MQDSLSRDGNREAEIAFQRLACVVLGQAQEGLASKNIHDVLHQSLEHLRDQRQYYERLQLEVQSWRTSKAWKLVHALRRMRRFAIPPGSLRASAARKVWRALLGRSLSAGPTAGAARRVGFASREFEREFHQLRLRRQPGQKLFVFLPSIPWTCDLFQRPQHLARHLAQAGHLVIYDCSGTSEDLHGLIEKEPNLFLFKGDTDSLAELPDSTLWAFTYNYSLRDQYPKASAVVYDWIDDLSVFPYNQAMLRCNHERALREADVVVSVAAKLHQSALKSRPDAISLPNAVEFDRFAAPQTHVHDPVLNKLMASGKPIAGYYGALASWFDLELLQQVATLRPNWNFLLIGPDYDGSLPGHAVLRQPNVHWIGPRPYAELPAYLQAMTCATIPFKINDITLATSPLKLYEYLAGGKPVVTTPMPECAAYPEVKIAATAQEFVRALDESQLSNTNIDACKARQAVGKANSWAVRCETVLRRLNALDQTRDLQTSRRDQFFHSLVAHFEHVVENPCYRLWFEYAYTSNERGRTTAQLLSEFTSLEGKDYLDVGCAYGGFVAAFYERGANVQGFDLDPNLLKLARSNLRQQGIQGPLHQLDATSDLVAKRFQHSQDVITCNDVIEHVHDPARLVKNLASALRPDGYLYLEIPNKDYLPYIVEDGHFKLFGITLLEHDEAKAYYAEVAPGVGYSVGHYLSLPEYETLLRDAGLEVTLLEQCVKYVDLKTVLRSAETLATAAVTKLETVPPGARQRVREELQAFLDRFQSSPRSEASDLRAFLVRYGVSFWQILAHKPQVASTPGRSAA